MGYGTNRHFPLEGTANENSFETAHFFFYYSTKLERSQMLFTH